MPGLGVEDWNAVATRDKTNQLLATSLTGPGIAEKGGEEIGEREGRSKRSELEQERKI